MSRTSNVAGLALVALATWRLMRGTGIGSAATEVGMDGNGGGFVVNCGNGDLSGGRCGKITARFISRERGITGAGGVALVG